MTSQRYLVDDILNLSDDLSTQEYIEDNFTVDDIVDNIDQLDFSTKE